MTDKTKKLILTLSVLSLLVLLPVMAKSSVYVKKMDTPGTSLEEKWKQALSYRDSQIDGGSYWIVYAIEKMMNEGSSFGMCNSSDSTDLGFLLYGKHSSFRKSSDVDIDKMDGQIIISKNDDGKNRIKVLKKLAIMFRVDENAKIIDFGLVTLDCEVCLRDLPVVWIGEFPNSESLNFLKKTYNRTESLKGKEGIVAAVANHEQTAEITPFLKNVIDKEDSPKLRESAIFWLGTIADEEIVDYLTKLALSDESRKIRKEAVFAIYISKSPNRVDALLKMVKNSDDMTVKKESVFWLGQYKSDEITKTLGDIVNDSKETELQKTAVFALSQNHSSSSVQKLINIARNHKSAKVRKEAIFWLGQMDSDEAVDAIIKLVEEN